MRVQEAITEAAMQASAAPAPEVEVLTAEELAAWLKVDVRWVDKYSHARMLPGMFKMGKSWRYFKAEVVKQIVLKGKILLDSPWRGH